MKASDVMVTNVITLGPETGVRDAARILLASRISAAPVVGERGELKRFPLIWKHIRHA